MYHSRTTTKPHPIRLPSGVITFFRFPSLPSIAVHFFSGGEEGKEVGSLNIGNELFVIFLRFATSLCKLQCHFQCGACLCSSRMSTIFQCTMGQVLELTCLGHNLRLRCLVEIDDMLLHHFRPVVRPLDVPVFLNHLANKHTASLRLVVP